MDKLEIFGMDVSGLGVNKMLESMTDAAPSMLEGKVRPKKGNPFAIATAMQKKKGFGTKKKEAIIKAIKKKVKESQVVVLDNAINWMLFPSLIGKVYEASAAPAGAIVSVIAEEADDQVLDKTTVADIIAGFCPMCGGQKMRKEVSGDYRCRDCSHSVESMLVNDGCEVEESKQLQETQNADVIELFLSDSFPKDKKPVWGTKNLRIAKRDNGWALINYVTPILYRANGSDKVVFNTQKYSPTTSKIQGKIRSVAASLVVDLDYVDEAGIAAAMSAAGTTAEPESSDVKMSDVERYKLSLAKTSEAKFLDTPEETQQHDGDVTPTSKEQLGVAKSAEEAGLDKGKRVNGEYGVSPKNPQPVTTEA